MKKWTIGRKLVAAFILMAAIMLCLGITGFYSVNSLSGEIDDLAKDYLPSVQNLLTAVEAQRAVDSGENGLISTSMAADERKEIYDKLDADLARADKALKAFEKMDRSPDEQKLWDKLVPAWVEWKKAHEEYVKLAKDYDSIKQDPKNIQVIIETLSFARIEFKGQVQEWKDLLLRGHEQENYDKYLANFQNQEKKVQELLSKSRDIMKPLGLNITTIDAALQKHIELGVKYRDALKNFNKSKPDGYRAVDQAVKGMDRPFSEELGKAVTVITDLLKSMNDSSGKMNVQMGNLDKAFKESNSELNALAAMISGQADHDAKAAENVATTSKLTMLAAAVAGVVIAMVLGLMISLGINKSLRRIAGILSDGAGKVASASGQVSSASQSLAQGSSEQAASIEETSSSVEEMASMTKQNAANSGEAKNLVAAVSQSAQAGGVAMQRMDKAIKEIKESSDQTAKIVKTIDEIAFQTNLLALNAAVEAARAGEAGKGFAVVAEEVRNLAQRSAQAAKNTSNLIEESVKKSEAGVAISTEANKSFAEIADGINKVSNLVGEIAAASNEQAQGIEQINTAVSQMDKVTQQTAASAEESASASEELSAQAEELNRIVGDLLSMVGGKSEKSGSAAIKRAEPIGHAPTQVKPDVRKTARSAVIKPVPHAIEPKAVGGKDNKMLPSDVIPLDSEDELKKTF